MVKIKAIPGICSYLHNLTGPILKARKQPVIKRMPPYNNPRRIGTTTEFLVDLSAHSNPDLEPGSKRFWLESTMITRIKYQIQMAKGHGKAARGAKKTSTIQVVELFSKGCLVKKQFRFTVGSAVSKKKAIKKAKNWIKENTN